MKILSREQHNRLQSIQREMRQQMWSGDDSLSRTILTWERYVETIGVGPEVVEYMVEDDQNYIYKYTLNDLL